eukprot:SM000070S21284  [mRNA]  locus=s70:67975:71690:- [translate_table: standard]
MTWSHSDGAEAATGVSGHLFETIVLTIELLFATSPHLDERCWHTGLTSSLGCLSGAEAAAAPPRGRAPEGRPPLGVDWTSRPVHPDLRCGQAGNHERASWQADSLQHYQQSKVFNRHVAQPPAVAAHGVDQYDVLESCRQLMSLRLAEASVPQYEQHSLAMPHVYMDLHMDLHTRVAAEARKSRMDAYGNLKCLSCGKILKMFAAMEQHLLSKHDGINSEERKFVEAQAQVTAASAATAANRRHATYMADVIAAATTLRLAGGKQTLPPVDNYRKASFQGTSASAQGVSPVRGQYRDMQMVVNPNVASSTLLIQRRGKERLVPKKKKLSALKKVILRERAMKQSSGEVLEGNSAEGDSNAKPTVGAVASTSTSTHCCHNCGVCTISASSESKGGSDAGLSEGHSEDSDEEARDNSSNSSQARLPSAAEDLLEQQAQLPGWEKDWLGGLADHGGQSFEQKPASSLSRSSDEWPGMPHAPNQQSLEEMTKEKAKPNTYIGPDVHIRYCNQVITTELNRVTTELLKELLRFQERAKAKDVLKAKKKRRLVVGLREVSRAVRTKRAKCIIVAPNIEEITSEGGLDSTVTSILQQAGANEVTVVFALTKSRIAQAFGRRVRMSTVAICDYDGANSLFKEMVSHAAKGREQWLALHKDGATSHCPPQPTSNPSAL